MASSVHVSLNVSDLGKSVDFYRGFFGEPRKLKSDYAKFVNAEPEIHLALAPGLSPGSGTGPLSHLGIRVESTEAVRRWRSEPPCPGGAAIFSPGRWRPGPLSSYWPPV